MLIHDVVVFVGKDVDFKGTISYKTRIHIDRYLKDEIQTGSHLAKLPDSGWLRNRGGTMWGDNVKHKLSLNQDENFTFLGRGVDFNGVISFEGTVRIDGRLKGEIH
ncbi:MAG: hypothetical protein ACREIS_09685, partial [Nitrospiraceae bacterium]